MRISIVIPAYNEEKLLRHTLERIQFALNDNVGKGVDFSWEIIVCDNNSNENS